MYYVRIIFTSVNIYHFVFILLIYSVYSEH